MKRIFRRFRDDRFALTTLQNPNLEVRTYAELVQAAQQERENQPAAAQVAATQPLAAPPAPVPHRDIPLHIFLTATDPDSEISQTIENKGETIFLPQQKTHFGETAIARSVFLGGWISATTPRKSAKQKINRQPAGDQNQTRQSSRSPIAQQHHQNHAGPNYVKPRHHRITKRLVRTLRQWPQTPQTKNPNDSQNVKNQNSGNNVVQQIAIKIPIFSGNRIERPRQNQKRRPNALHQQRNPRHSRPIQNSSALEKKSIARHSVISPRTSEQHPVDAPKSGNHDSQSHQSNAQPRKHSLQSSRSHAIRFRVLDRSERKRAKITKIHQQVQSDDHARTQRQ